MGVDASNNTYRTDYYYGSSEKLLGNQSDKNIKTLYGCALDLIVAASSKGIMAETIHTGKDSKGNITIKAGEKTLLTLGIGKDGSMVIRSGISGLKDSKMKDVGDLNTSTAASYILKEVRRMSGLPVADSDPVTSTASTRSQPQVTTPYSEYRPNITQVEPKTAEVGSKDVDYQKLLASFVPNEYIGYIMENSRKYNINPLVAAALMWQESKFDPDIVSPAGCKGLMQLQDETAENMGVPSGKIFDPKLNTMAGIKYMSILMDHADIDNDLRLALAGYNAGPGSETGKSNRAATALREFKQTIIHVAKIREKMKEVLEKNGINAEEFLNNIGFQRVNIDDKKTLQKYVRTLERNGLDPKDILDDESLKLLNEVRRDRSKEAARISEGRRSSRKSGQGTRARNSGTPHRSQRAG